MLSASGCDEERLLAAKYKAAIRAYRDMIAILGEVPGDRQFEDAYERAEGARQAFVHARFDHRYHIQEHGCVPAEEEAATAP